MPFLKGVQTPPDLNQFKTYWSHPPENHPATMLYRDEGYTRLSDDLGFDATLVLRVVRLDMTPEVQNWNHTNFVNDVADVLYWQEAEFNQGIEGQWSLFVRTTQGLYISLQSSCEYTGFDIGGQILFHVTCDPIKLWWQAFTDTDRVRMMLHGVQPAPQIKDEIQGPIKHLYELCDERHRLCMMSDTSSQDSV